MARRGDQDQVVVPERNDLDLALLDRESDEAEINRVVEDILIDQVRAPIFDANVDRRVVLQKALDVRRKLVEAYRIDGLDTNRAANDLLHLLQLAQELVVAVQKLLGSVVDPLTLPRQL